MSGQRITKRLTLSIAAALVVIVSSYTPSAAAASSPGFGSSQRATPAPLAAANSRLRREVFGFVNSSKLGDNAVGYPSWNFSLLSTVAFFRLQVNSGNGYIVPAPDAGWNTFHSSTMTNFVSTAHAYGTRVIVSINLHDMSTSPTNQVCTGLLSANYTNTINESLQLVHDAGIDVGNRVGPDLVPSGWYLQSLSAISDSRCAVVALGRAAAACVRRSQRRSRGSARCCRRRSTPSSRTRSAGRRERKDCCSRRT